MNRLSKPRRELQVRQAGLIFTPRFDSVNLMKSRRDSRHPHSSFASSTKGKKTLESDSFLNPELDPTESSPESSSQDFRAAQKKTMNLLSRRNYSSFELSKKLRPCFDESTVQQTLQWAHEQKWFPDEKELVDRTTELLIRKGKGSQYIFQQLKEKGLKTKNIPFEVEYESARAVADSKLNLLNKKSTPESKLRIKEKLFRFLLQRGFPVEIVRKVVHEKLTS